MKRKGLVICLLAVILVGCSKPKENTVLKVLAPKGAPSLSLVEYAKNNTDAVTLVDGTDVITAALASPNHEYDVIVAPINLGMKLIEKGNTEYRLHSVVTWGNLYLVQNNDVDSNLPVALFGEGAVPSMVFDTTMTDVTFEQNIQYFNSVAEVQAQLLSSKASYGLLAEPALTATIQKAKEKNINLTVAYDLQEKWASVTGLDNYPQAAIFVLPNVAKDQVNALDSLTLSMQSVNKEMLESSLTGNEELFGVPNAKIIVSAWDNMNIQYAKATDKKAEIKQFLDLFDIVMTDDMMIQ